MTNKHIIVILIFLFTPCILIAQTDATLSVKKGDDMFKETRYADALRYYYDALEYQEEEIPGLQTKIEKTEHCKILMDKILQAHEYGWNEDEEKYLRQLYKIHPSKLLKLKIDEFDEQRREQEEIKREQELKEQAEREAEERRIQFEQEKQRQEDERRRIEERKQEEARRWNEACKSNTINSYNAFINKFPQSQNKSEALRRIKELEDAQKWEQVRRVNTIDGYQKYIDAGGIYKDKAYEQIDKLYWDKARLSDNIEAYEDYLSRTTKYTKSYRKAAQDKIEKISNQTKILADAELITDVKQAYYKVQTARNMGALPSYLETKALKLEEPYAYDIVKGRKISSSEKRSYLSKYAQVAPPKHLKTIRTQVNREYQVTSSKVSPSSSRSSSSSYSSASSSYSVKKTNPNYTLRTENTGVFSSYFDNNGMVQYTWIMAEGYLGTSLGGCMSIFEWRFGPVEIAPIVWGYNYTPQYIQRLDNPTFSKLLSHSIDEFYYQPTIRFYFPLRNSENHAIFIAGAPTIGIETRTWFMAEMGYNYNSGLLNGNIFMRYNGDFVIGAQLKICHVFKKKH